MSGSDASEQQVAAADEPESRIGGVPLYVWVLGAVLLAIPLGFALRVDGSIADRLPSPILGVLQFAVNLLITFPDVVIRALQSLAAPLVVLAILSAIVTNDIPGRQGLRMMLYYLVNTLIAMVIGLALVSIVQPGRRAQLSDPSGAGASAAEDKLIDRLAPRDSAPRRTIEGKSLRTLLVEMVPRSIGEALATNNIAQLVVITLPLGIGLALIRNEERRRGVTRHQAVIDLLSVGFDLLLKVLLWVVALVPLAVFGVVAITLAREGTALFVQLGMFIGVVVAGLLCQVTYYLGLLAVLARVGPLRFLRGAADVMATTFSTASTAATMPVTLRSLQSKLGVSRASSQLAACVGTNFNNDGTALYQAVAAVFFAQAQGAALSVTDQLVIILTALVASVGAGGIPSGSFVTMPLIFTAVGLSPAQIPILLTVDWFLDRCRTTSNVLGDMTVALLLDRTHSPSPQEVRAP